jgi:hypothetical protein
MVYTLLTLFKTSNLTSLIFQGFQRFYYLILPTSNINNGRYTPIRPEAWQNKMEQIFRRTSSNLSCYKERRVLPNILPLVDTNGSIKKLTLFLPGLALLQSPRNKYLVA